MTDPINLPQTDAEARQAWGTSELDAMEEAARRATKGPWFADGYSVNTDGKSTAGYPPSPKVIANLMDDEYVANPNHENDSAYIASANPDRILALCGEVRRLSGRISEMESEIRMVRADLALARQVGLQP